MTFEQLIAEALALPTEHRARLVDQLLASLDPAGIDQFLRREAALGRREDLKNFWRRFRTGNQRSQIVLFPLPMKAPDAIIVEVRRVKADLMKWHDLDLAAMFRDGRARQSKSGRKVVTKSAGA